MPVQILFAASLQSPAAGIYPPQSQAFLVPSPHPGAEPLLVYCACPATGESSGLRNGEEDCAALATAMEA
jgi:hypothetical protein